MLYELYRPQEFNQVIGQPCIKTIKNLVKNKEKGLIHTWILEGKKGSGKTSTARIIAKAYNCENPQNGEPCGKCKSCKTFESGNNINVIELDAAKNGNVDSMKKIIEQTQYSTGGIKVYIIDEVHLLTNDAGSAALKTFEEPPKNCVFILCTTDPQKLKSAVLSRCVHFRFRKIKSKNILEKLRKVCTAENIQYEENALRLIADISNGDMRDSETYLEQFSSTGTITEQEIRDCLGLNISQALMNIVDAFIKKDKNKAIASIGSLFYEGQDANIFISKLILFFRELLMVKTFETAEISDIYTDNEKDFILSNKDNITEDDLKRYIKAFVHVEQEAKIQPNSAQVLMEIAVLDNIKINELCINTIFLAKMQIANILDKTTSYREAAQEIRNSSILIKDNIIMIHGVSPKNTIVITQGFMKTLKKKVEIVFV